jgi:hypothetical protein
MKLNSYLLKSTVVAALGGLLFGFDTAVIAGTTRERIRQIEAKALRKLRHPSRSSKFRVFLEGSC